MSLTYKDVGKREKNIKWSCNATGSPRPCPSCSCLFLPFLCMESGSALRGLLKVWALWWRADVQTHRQRCSQLKDLRVLCQLPLEGSWFLQAQDICTLSITTPATEAATDSASQTVGTFHPGAHRLVGYITKTSAVPIFICAVCYQQPNI